MLKTHCTHFYNLAPSIFLITRGENIVMASHDFTILAEFALNSHINHYESKKTIRCATFADITCINYSYYINAAYSLYEYCMHNNELYRMPKSYYVMINDLHFDKIYNLYKCVKSITRRCHDLALLIMMIMLELIRTDLTLYVTK